MTDPGSEPYTIVSPHDVPTSVQLLQASTTAQPSRQVDDRTGALLRLLASSKPGGWVLELGTGDGVGTAWLWAGLSPHARLLTVDADAFVTARAQRLLGPDRRVEFLIVEPSLWLSEDKRQAPFDLIYLRARLPGGIRQVIHHMDAGSLLVIDDPDGDTVDSGLLDGSRLESVVMTGGLQLLVHR
jgi:predicted O-methyltransferase YrrM